MPTTNRTSGTGRVIMNPAPKRPTDLKLGKFTTDAPGVNVKSNLIARTPNSPVNVTISRAVRPFSEAGTLNVTINGAKISVPVKGTDRPAAIAAKLEKALEKANPNLEVRIKPSEGWGNQPVGSSKTELVIGLKEHFKPGGPLGPTINPAPRPQVTVNPAPPPPTRPKPTVNPAPPRPQPTVNPAPARPKPTVNPAPRRPDVE